MSIVDEQFAPELVLKKLKNSKAQIKGELTRFTSFLNKTDLDQCIELLQARYDSAKSILDKFKSIQTEYEELLITDFPSNYDEGELGEERDNFETRYFEAVAIAQGVLEKHFHNQRQTNVNANRNTESPSTSASLQAIAGSGDSVVSPKSCIKLPSLTLPEFSGCYADWQRFRDMFMAVIHDNHALSDAQRFYYLEASLRGEPKTLLASLAPTNANYAIAWDLLERRYQNTKFIINSHLKEIMEFPALAKESHIALRNFSNHFFKNFRALESLGEKVREWNTMWIYILVSKLDISTRREWERYSQGINSPKIDQFNEFLMQRCQVLEAVDSRVWSNPKKSNESRSFATTSTTYRPACPFCKGEHFIYSCEEFKRLSISNRFEKVKRMNLCTNCLRHGHKLSECRSSGCKMCRQRHATLLHKPQQPSRAGNVDVNRDNGNSSRHDNSNPHEGTSEQNTSHPILTNTCQNARNCLMLLSTAVVDAYGKHKTRIPCRVLLDSASQSNFVSTAMIKQLQLTPSKVDIPVLGINQIQTRISHATDISVASRTTAFKTKLSFLVVPKITEVAPQSYFDKLKLNIPDELVLADPEFNVPSEIDMLLGCEVFLDLLCIGQLKLGRTLPTLQKTLLGWIIAGRVPHQQGRLGKTQSMMSNCFLAQNPLERGLEKFWLVEEANSHSLSHMTEEERECEEHFIKTTVRDEGGRFVVKLPLKQKFTDLGDSKQTALNRLYAIERRLAKTHELGTAYRAFMQEYKDLGHMTEVPREPTSSEFPIYYIPHHCVQKLESMTTKLRVVFDAACKTTKGSSLNDVLKVGPTIQKDLFSILLRFRKHNFVLIGDITKMYRQILVDEHERDLQRIVWRDTPNEEVRHYQLNTVTYGTASASYLATRCLIKISQDVAEQWPRESETIASDFYVDDLLTGSSDLDSLKRLGENIRRILAKYGFELRQFRSNAHQLLDEIAKDGHEKKYLISDDSSSKTLGISWVPSLDTFEYDSKKFAETHGKVTKRTILSWVSKIFDPLGIVGFLTVRVKLLIQRLWQLKIDWDEGIPSQLHAEWVKLKNEIARVGLLQVPRHVLVNKPKTIEIHGFSDASERAYGCCIYLRSIDENGQIASHLLCAKSRVSPLKVLSLPRLELLGAALLADLVKRSADILALPITKTFLWTDSTIVLCWIANEPKRWKTFTANRVAAIQSLTDIDDWHHVKSEENPADIISRGTSIREPANRQLWFHGPSFLVKPEGWPKDSAISRFAAPTKDTPGLKEAPEVSLVAQCPDDEIFDRFSCLHKLLRVVAYCVRFGSNAKLPKGEREAGPLSPGEVQQAEWRLIRIVQARSFPAESRDLSTGRRVSTRSKLKSLSPFLAQDGMIRLGGRLSNSNYTYNVKHPIVLPAKHPLTQLIIAREHRRTLHAGAQCTLAHVRQRYWPLNGKQIVRAHIRKCMTCFKSNPSNTLTPRMGELPISRVTPSRPFSSVAVDYAGPFELKDGKTRSRKTIKGYICIFVCLAIKAVHIEVVTDLTSDGFLSMLKRFVSRRGLCSFIYSDNATNFVGCNNELRAIQNIVRSSPLQNFLTNSNIKWQFMPARSPHWGGLHEAAVKSCKHHLKRVLNGSRFHYEEFYTITTQIEAILNSRPLIPMSSDPNDLKAFTPAHFLIGQELTAIPERDRTDDKVNFNKRYQHLQIIGQHFWSRWRKEYLHQLQTRNKWQIQPNHDVQVGALVLLKEDHAPSLCWPLGRITAVHPGPDNIVRVVSVRTKGGVLKRSVARVALLPVA
ncbi:uncharacterized protein [Euwallacea fornicatus]|uniref:uncharacterized protein n=1 Tax=Euwallacea fornicatus TaxID=995702 RepID=UPI00338F1DF7